MFDWCNRLWKSRQAEHLGLGVEGNLVLLTLFPPFLPGVVKPLESGPHSKPLTAASIFANLQCFLQLQIMLQKQLIWGRRLSTQLWRRWWVVTHRCSQVCVPLRFHKTVEYFHQADNQVEKTCSDSENEIWSSRTYRCILRVSFSGLWNNCSHTCSKSWPLHDPEGHRVHHHK